MVSVKTSVGSACALAGAALLLFTAPSFAISNPHDRSQPPLPGSSGTCESSAMSYSVATDLQTTGSKKYRDVSGASVSFNQGSAGCVEVSFSAEAAATPRELLLTRVLLDGAPCLPSDNIFASDSPSSDLADRAMNYICTGVAAGNHTAKVQFRSRFGGKVALDFRTIIVRYAP